MFRSNSPFDIDASSYAESIQSNVYSTLDEVSSQVSNLSRPSAKSIYLQRKEYAESINNMMDKFQFRVEHLFTCDLDGDELRSVTDCVERLKLLDEMGRVWGQNMLMEVRGPKLLLTDIETKEELESIALNDILELKAVLDSGLFNSLLTVSVQNERNHTTTVFLFQCEDVRANFVERSLSRALSDRKEDSSVRSSNAGLIAKHEGMKNVENSSEPKEEMFAIDPMPQWLAPDYEEDDVPEPEQFVPQEEEEVPLPQTFTTEEEPPSQRPYTELDRNVDILNHILGDIEIFMGKVAAVVAKNAKKKKKKKKGKAMDGMPPAAEFAVCFHKIKSGFNLLGELNGKINNPSAPQLVHSLFSTLAFVVSHSPEDLAQTIVAPLLIPQCIRLMSEEASAEEDQLWQSLGDAWNIPSTKWPEDDEDIPTYTLEFFDGWQPPEVSAAPKPREPVSRREDPQPGPSQTAAKWRPSQPAQPPQPSQPAQPARQPQPPQPPQPSQQPQPPKKAISGLSKPIHMHVVYDFDSRNHRELTVRKGDIVELLDKSKQWWKVRDSRGEEGFVPNNVLQANNEQPIEHIEGPPVLTKRSKAAEVKAWLEDKGFSKITVRCLGVLSGTMLLGMTREELKTLCPEEGGRVFFQLQAVKSNMAAAS